MRRISFQDVRMLLSTDLIAMSCHFLMVLAVLIAVQMSVSILKWKAVIQLHFHLLHPRRYQLRVATCLRNVLSLVGRSMKLYGHQDVLISTEKTAMSFPFLLCFVLFVAPMNVWILKWRDAILLHYRRLFPHRNQQTFRRLCHHQSLHYCHHRSHHLPLLLYRPPATIF